MSSISLGQAIGIIGGVPILKNVLGHTVDHLKIPRHLDIGTIGTSATQQNILSSVLSGGIGSLLQSPLAAALAPLTTAISGALTSLNALTSGTSMAPLVTALGSLSISATNLSALADNLVGVGANAALPSLLDVVGHMGAVQSLGSLVPSNLSLATVLAPVQSASLLTKTLSSLQPVVAQAIAGTMTVSNAAAAVGALQASLDAVTNASTTAVSTVQAAQPALCAASSAIALLVGGTSDVVSAMKVAIRPDMLAKVQGIVTAHTEALTI